MLDLLGNKLVYTGVFLARKRQSMVYIQIHLLSTEQCPVLTDSSVGKLSIASPKSKGLCLCIPFFTNIPYNWIPYAYNLFMWLKTKQNKRCMWWWGVRGGQSKQDTCIKIMTLGHLIIPLCFSNYNRYGVQEHLAKCSFYYSLKSSQPCVSTLSLL